MHRILLILFAVICWNGLAAQQASTRLERHHAAVASNALELRFPDMLQALALAIDSEDAQAMIHRQREVLACIRQFQENQTYAAQCNQILEDFEGFSFHVATPDERAAKLDLLERFQKRIAP